MIEIKTIASSSAGNCYVIRDDRTSIVLEAGITFDKLQRALKFKTRQIKGVFITHEHGDHAKYAEQYAKNGLNIYMTKGTQDALGIRHHRLCNIRYKVPTRVGSLVIMPYETKHDVAEPCGFIIKSDHGGKLLFATDTYLIRYTVPGITHMMIEVNHDYDRMMENVEKGLIHKGRAIRTMRAHLNLENAIKYLKKSDLSQLKEVHLLHLSKENAKEREIKEKIQEVAGVPVTIAKGEK